MDHDEDEYEYDDEEMAIEHFHQAAQRAAEHPELAESQEFFRDHGMGNAEDY